MMTRQHDAEVAIVGLGVIGGSAALRLRERGTPVRGFSTSAEDCERARQAGVSVASSLDAAIRDVGLVLIAVPLDRVCSVATKVIGASAPSATLLHAASLQGTEALRSPAEITARLIGTHPLAGSHESGFGAARADLFRSATVFVERRANARQRADAELFWSLAGAQRIEYATANEHDAAMAWISHLPQLASTALANALAVKRPGAMAVRPGPGARDATRLAMSNFEMWQPILERAPAESSTALRTLEESIRRLRTACEAGDWSTVQEIWEGARKWRRAAEQREDA